MSALAVSNIDAGDCTARAPLSGWRWSDTPYRDIDLPLPDNFRLESGDALEDAALRIRLHGPEGAPLVVALGGISAGKKVADAGPDTGWWREVVRPQGAIDLERFRVLGLDFLPGSEKEIKTITPADQARALAFALDSLGVDSAHALVGASYGGFVCLAFASLYPDRARKLAVISAAARPDPMATALRGVQRRVIAFALEAGRPEEGVALARQLAMTTYRTAEEFRGRFRSEPSEPRAGGNYDVCDYLTARGKSYARAMTPQRYVSLSDSLDRADIDAAAVTAECLFVAARSDRLVPAIDTEATAKSVSGPSQFHLVESLVGHDAFLCEPEKYSSKLKSLVEQ